MDVTVALESRYLVTPDGCVWSQGGMALSFWNHYLEVFDRVRIVARGARVERVPEGSSRVDSENVSFHGLPDYQGPWEYIKRYSSVRRAIRAAAPSHGAVILRV